LIARWDVAKNETIEMILKVFASGNVLQDKNGTSYYINRRNVAKAISPIDLKRAIHISTAEYNIYVPVEGNPFKNEIELYKQFFIPSIIEKVKEGIFNWMIKYI
jgi:hypothetical protein